MYKPNLKYAIKEKLLKINYLNYKDIMQSIIFKIEKIENVVVGTSIPYNYEKSRF